MNISRTRHRDRPKAIHIRKLHSILTRITFQVRCHNLYENVYFLKEHKNNVKNNFIKKTGCANNKSCCNKLVRGDQGILTKILKFVKSTGNPLNAY